MSRPGCGVGAARLTPWKEPEHPRRAWDRMTREPGCDPASEALGEVKARIRRPGPRVDAAVLVLLWGCRVLLVRKSCSAPGPWACDAAFPGGRLEQGEGPVEAALREAWEEAWVHPSVVEVLGVMEPEATRTGGVLVAPVLARPRGPLDPAPRGGEVDAALLAPLEYFRGRPGPVEHPRRGAVVGYRLPGGLVVWGLTMRILRRLSGYM